MRRVIVVATACIGLAGCTSFSMDAFRSAPPTVPVQLESIPPGADARTSLGPGCTTPCSVSVPATEGFSVSYSLPKYQPLTVSVQVTKVPGDFTTAASTTIDPNPVVGQLQPAAPPPKPRRKIVRKRKPAAAAAAPAPAAETTPFPAPAAAASAPR